jgi:hypothetical protein
MWKNEGTGATLDGKFQDPSPPTPRSVLGADWLNMIQDELQNLVLGAGIALVEGNHSQVLAAVIALAQGNGFRTGDGKITLRAAADPGWVMANDGTIGSAGSGATTLAHASAQALYTLLWTNVADAHAPVTGGRGANAAADWAANKPIALTKALGRAIAIAGAGAGLTARTLGSVVGAESVVLTRANLPAVGIPTGIGSGGTNPGLDIYGSTTDDTPGDATGFIGSVDPGSPQSQSLTAPLGDGEATELMQPTAFWNVMIKL